MSSPDEPSRTAAVGDSGASMLVHTTQFVTGPNVSACLATERAKPLGAQNDIIAAKVKCVEVDDEFVGANGDLLSWTTPGRRDTIAVCYRDAEAWTRLERNLGTAGGDITDEVVGGARVEESDEVCRTDARANLDCDVLRLADAGHGVQRYAGFVQSERMGLRRVVGFIVGIIGKTDNFDDEGLFAAVTRHVLLVAVIAKSLRGALGHLSGRQALAWQRRHQGLRAGVS